MAWLVCEKVFIRFAIKIAYLVLIYGEFYGIMHSNKLKTCLFCIKIDNAIEKRERQKGCIERCVIFCRFFYRFFKDR